jgi:PAS domain S-box-containing protein
MSDAPSTEPGSAGTGAMGPTETAIPSIASLEQGDRPFVLADAFGNVISLNAAFTRTYGWEPAELIGEPLGLILPEAFRMSHQFGFSRFQATEISTILAHPLRLSTLCSDGREIVSEHYIVAEKREDGWCFGATLTPLPPGTAADP